MEPVVVGEPVKNPFGLHKYRSLPIRKTLPLFLPSVLPRMLLPAPLPAPSPLLAKLIMERKV
jgi:hypothetical protein